MNIDNQPSLFRVNYGNGQQVSSSMSRRAAERYLANLRLTDQYGKFAFIQFKDPETGEWFSARFLKERQS